MPYKFLREVDGKIKSENGDATWTIGKWKSIRGELDICHKGLHCSDGVYQAFSYVQGEILAEVEVGGRSIVEDDMSCHSKMRLVRAYRWRKEDSVALAIFAAELVIQNFEREHPNDDRPRKAIEAAKAYLDSPTKENRSAARSAARAAAWWAESAAWSAAWSAAGTAAWWAESAAESAARAAAWWAAWWAEAAAKQEFIQKIANWMQERVKELPEYDPNL